MFARLQTYIIAVVVASALHAAAAPASLSDFIKRQDVTGDNNNNAAGGSITNGDATTFNVSDTNDLSGLYNAGHSNGFNVSSSPVTGNTQKRQATTTGDNNGNSGNITNGDATNFSLTNGQDISGAYNVGHNNNFTSDGSIITGNNATTSARRKRQDVTGDNNNNAATGVITNGDTTSFTLNGDNDVSGIYNVGHANNASLANSNVTGNAEVSGARKRQNNNDNSGNITVGDATTFGFSNVSDASGGYNAGSDNTFTLTNGSLVGNTQAKRQTTTPSNNFNNSGSITNGDSTVFSIGNTTDLSGGYNAGSDNTFTLTNGSLIGNTQSKRQTSTPSDNNDNSGTIINGNTTTFGISNSNDVSGVYNAGSGNTVTLDGSTVTGNNQTASA